MANLGERIKRLLNEKGITQKELAEMVGCTDAAISHYIKGDRVPRSKVLSKIALALGTTSDYLMEGIPNDAKQEVGYATKLIARNANHMSNAEKMRIIKLLIGEENE